MSTDGFNSLDPLGPEYGRINAPNIDSKGLAAFEGDRIDAPKINFPSSDNFFPVLPNLQNLERPQESVKKNVVQKFPNKPGINKKANFQDIKNALNSDLRAQIQTNQDKNSYAKIYSYNSGPDGNAFYKRYAAYGQEAFDKIGFSPLRDNEAIFNERTTKWDDFSRMMTNSFLPLFWKGIVAGPKSLGKMLTGDFTSSDLQDAKEYSELAAIGQSSKGGAFGFTNNMLMNFSYSAGIMTEAIAEELIGALLAPETAGGSFFLTSANFLKNTAKAVKGLDMAVDGYKAVNTTLKTVESVSGARKFWEAARKVGTSSFNPLQNTFHAASTLGQTIKKGDQLYNFTNLAKAYKTAGGFYKDVRSMNMALSEARLEAGMVENQVYDNVYNKYYRDNGKAPDNQTQYEMMKQAKEASLNTLKWNTALIYGSNAITFPNIVGPKGGLPGFMRNTVKELQEVSHGKFGKLGSLVYDSGKKSFEFRKNNFVNMVKDWGRQPIYKSAKSTVGYFKSNFTEGAQESLQEVISGANEKYYSDSFQSPAVRSHHYSKGVYMQDGKTQADYAKAELRNQFGAQGIETFASGFFMGMLASPVNSSIEYMSTGYNKLFNKEAYTEFKNKKSEVMTGIANNLNAIDINDFLKAKVFNYGVQDLTAAVKNTGSVKQANDATDDAFLMQMSTVLETGTMDVFRDKLKDLKQLTPEEFEDAVPTVPKGEGAKYQSKLDDVIAKTEKVEKRHKYYSEKFPNPVNQDNLPPKGTPEYEDAVALHHAWNKSVDNAVYFGETFDFTLQRKADVMQKYLSKTPLKNMTQRESEVLFDSSKLNNEIAMLKEEVKSLEAFQNEESFTSKNRKDLADKQRRLLAMEELAESTNKFRNFFNRYEKADRLREELQKRKGDVPVTDEEVDAALDEFFGEYTDDNKAEKMANYKDAYTKYLKAVAELNDDHVFDKDIDDSFELLADHQKLSSEARQIMKYVNLLHDPGGFLDIVERNRKWMKDLYKKRKHIYEKMVADEFNIVVDNALLNALANKGIYISLDDFEAWQKDGTPPSEFYDHEAKMVIPEGTEQYEQYYMLFEQASEMKDEKTTSLPETLDSELKDLLDQLDQQKELTLDALPKKQVKVNKGQILPDKGDTFPFTKLLTEMEPEQYVDVEYGGEFPLTFYMHPDGQLRLDDKDGEIFDPSTASFEVQKANIYILEEQPDPELAKPIEEKFERYKEQIINEFNNKRNEASATTDEVKTVTSETPPEEMDPELYNTLYALFDKKYLSKLSTEEDLELADDSEKMRNAFIKFLQSDREAKQIIDDYNSNAKVDAATKETGEKQNFTFMYQGKKIDTATRSLPQLRVLQRRLKKQIEEIVAIKEPTTEDIANKNQYTIIVNDLEKLIATRAKEGLTPELQEAIKKIQELKDKQGEIVQSPAGYMIDGELYQRVTRVIQELKGDKYEYTNAKDVATAFYLTIGETPLTESNINEFIQELRSRNLSGFSEFTYNELQKELLDTLNETGTKSTDTNTEPINLISTPVSKIVEELSKFNTFGEKLNWLRNNDLLAPINLNGKEYNVIDYSDRVMVLMKIGNYNIPFYISTGQAGKKNVKAGNWYAVFGIGTERGWINKGTEEEINNNYGFTIFEKLSKILNEGIGRIESREDNGEGKLKEGIGFLDDGKSDIEAFNANMNLPTKPATSSSRVVDLYDHIRNTIQLLNNELKGIEASGKTKKATVQKETSLPLTKEELLAKIQQVVSEKTYEESRISGNYIDEQIKRLFEGDKPIEFDEKNITQEAFDELFGEKGFLTSLKKRVDNGEIYVVSQGIRVFDKELKIAGEIDLLVADTSGNITIVDVKTGEKSKWDNFKKKNNPNSKMEDYQLQQTAYANLLNRMIGVNPNIALLPVQMTREKETGRITAAGKPTSPTLLSSDYLIALSKAEVQDRINSVIPMPETPLSSVVVTPSSVVPTDAESSDDTESPTTQTGEPGEFISPEKEFDLSDFQKELDKVTDMDGLKALKTLLETKVQEGAINFDNLEKMSELMFAKKEEIDNNAIKIVPTSLEKDSQFIAKTTIFTPTKEVFAKENDTVIINSVNEKNKTVNVSNLGTSEKQDISFDDLNNLFNIKEVVMGATNPTETPMSKEGKSMVDKSIDLIEGLIQNKDGELDRIEKETIGKSIDNLDKELLEDLDC